MIPVKHMRDVIKYAFGEIENKDNKNKKDTKKKKKKIKK